MAEPTLPAVPMPWRVTVPVGVGTMALLATSDTAWSRWHAIAGDRVPRSVVRTLWWTTVAAHVVEVSIARRIAAKARLPIAGAMARTALYGVFFLGPLREAAAARPDQR